MKDLFATATAGQKAAIVELISELELDDAQNSIENATRCLNQQGVRELEVMASNYYYRAGINHIKNEIREILGLPIMRTELEQKRFDYAVKHPMGSATNWNCPPIEPHEFEVTEGSAKLIPLGEDGTLVVIGTKDRKKAARMMRRYQRDWLDDDLLAQDTELELKKMVWRKAEYEGESDFTHMYSWAKRDTKHNAKAIDAFIFEG